MAYANPVVAVNLLNVNIASPGTAAWDGIATSTFTAGTTRLLLARQTIQSQNGVWIWNGAKSALRRPSGADQYAHFHMLDNATVIWVQKGVTCGGTCWGVEPAAVIKVDATAHTLTRVALPDVVARAATTGAAGTVFDVTTHTYKSVDGIFFHVPDNGAPGSNIVLVTDQGLLGTPAPQNNGLYWANAGGAMVRTSEPLTPERRVWVSDGTVNAHSHYELTAASLTGEITLGVTPLNFSRQKLVVNASDFGACPGDAMTDCTAAVLAALANAQANTNVVQYPTYRELKLPAGAIQLTQPLRITSSNFVLSGAGRGTTNIRPNFQGPWCVIGPTLTDVPPVHSDGPVIGGTQRNCFHPDQGRSYSVDLRAHACGELGASATKLTVEAWVYFVDASLSTIAGSFGSPTGIAVNDIAFKLSGTGGGALAFQVWMQAERTSNQNVNVTGGTIPIGSWVHVAVDWDNSTIRLLIDGIVVSSTSTAGSPWHLSFIRQKPWEGVWLGRVAGILGDGDEPSSKIRIGPTRGCLRSVYADGGLISGSTYTEPAALFPSGDSTDVWVINWDIGLQGDPTLSDMFRGYSGGGRPVWFFVYGQQHDLLNSLNGVKVSGLGVYSDNGVQCGGSSSNKRQRVSSRICTWSFHFADCTQQIIPTNRRIEMYR